MRGSSLPSISTKILTMSKENLDDSNEWHLWTQMPYVHHKKSRHDKNKTIQLPKISTEKEKEKDRKFNQRKDYKLSHSDDEPLSAKVEKENKREKIQEQT
tara:strand:+ start:5189 stop:5488 length:300 start_codon:yes stop_codon:yes gene_type:complete